jgi:hypothetical protein
MKLQAPAMSQVSQGEKICPNIKGQGLFGVEASV